MPVRKKEIAGKMYDHKQSVKELIRHILFRCGLTDTLDMLRHWRGQSTRHMRQRNMNDIFSQIYANQAWVMEEGQDSLSGAGSTKAATSELVVRLSAFLREAGCRQLVDIGCGDFNWMRNVEGDFNYLGCKQCRVCKQQTPIRVHGCNPVKDRSGRCGSVPGGSVPPVVSRWIAVAAQYQGSGIQIRFDHQRQISMVQFRYQEWRFSADQPAKIALQIP
jgi:hypothetical protein